MRLCVQLTTLAKRRGRFECLFQIGIIYLFNNGLEAVQPRPFFENFLGRSPDTARGPSPLPAASVEDRGASADHLAFYRRGRCTNPEHVDDWLTIRPDSFDAPEMHCKLLVARANKRGDYLAKFWCDDLMQNYWFSLFSDRLYVSLTDREP